MQIIFEGIDLYEDLPNNFIKQSDNYVMPYKQISKIHSSNMLITKLHNNFTQEQIQIILKTYFDFAECMSKVMRGKTRYFLMAGATFLVCNDIDIVLKLFSEIVPDLHNKKIIVMYSVIMNSDDNHYDKASAELAYRSS